MQAQILGLINELKDEFNTSVLFITHDLGVVAQVADRVAVMQMGRIVEQAGVRDLYRNPYHPYTRRLIAAVPHKGYEARQRELLKPVPPPEGAPAHMGFEQPANAPDLKPHIHRFADNRELLLWPNPQGVTP